MAEKLKVTLVKSPIGAIPKQKATVEALGLKKLNKTVELPDNEPAVLTDLYLSSEFSFGIPVISGAAVVGIAMLSGNSILFSSKNQIILQFGHSQVFTVVSVIQ